jgi:hypothetical protein
MKGTCSAICQLLEVFAMFNKGKVTLSLCLTKHHAMKAYGGVEV